MFCSKGNLVSGKVSIMDMSITKDAMASISYLGAGAFNIFIALVFSRVKSLKKLHFNRTAYFNAFGILASILTITATTLLFPSRASLTQSAWFWALSIAGLSSIIILFALAEFNPRQRKGETKNLKLFIALFLYIYFFSTTAGLLTILQITQSTSYRMLQGGIDVETFDTTSAAIKYEVVVFATKSETRSSVSIINILAKQSANMKTGTYKFYIKNEEIIQETSLMVGLKRANTPGSDMDLNEYTSYVFLNEVGNSIWAATDKLTNDYRGSNLQTVFSSTRSSESPNETH